MQSPKNILTGMALGAVILTTQATAQSGAPEAHIAASTQGAKVHTFNYSLGSSVETDGASVDAADGVTGQGRPDVRKYADIGKASIGTATVKQGQVLSLALVDGRLGYFGTGNTGSCYQVSDAVATRAHYPSGTGRESLICLANCDHNLRFEKICI